MNKYPKLTKDVIKSLKDEGVLIEEEYYLYPEKQRSPKADIIIRKDSNNWIAVEIEETQTHPDTNILKYWEFLEKNKNLSLKLIQILGRGFVEGKTKKGNYVSRVNNCKFLKVKMEDDLNGRFKYVLEDLKDHGFNCCEDYRAKREEVKDKIIEIIMKNSH